ncbi:hypothetical protein Fcan01_20729 [Folsomia candida]|uniref:Uncharacterized protein n=1 Tax=Folsomia candida TaxID=158441 RepID=A0A226DIE9_FOLCA|nr:hypothetical protein Fcan01_20729 [Folsomia candida]
MIKLSNPRDAFIRITLIYLIRLISGSRSLWTISNLFADCTFQFVFVANNKFGNFDVTTDLHRWTKPNLNTPLLLNTIIPGTDSFLERNNSSLFPVRTQSWLKSTRSLTTFVTLNSGKFENGQYHSTILIFELLRRENPTYIIAHLDEPSSRKYYTLYPIWRGNSKLILYNFNAPAVIWIPCVACHGNAKSHSTQDTTTLQDLDKIWIARNSNMQHRIVQDWTVSRYDIYKTRCGPSLSRFEGEYDVAYCAIWSIGKQYNFTIRPGPDSTLVLGQPETYYVGLLAFQIVLNNSTMRTFIDSKDGFLSSSWVNFGFEIVTQFPSSIDNFNVFLSPFDKTTWMLIVLSCVIITIVLQFDTSDKEIRVPPIFEFIRVAAILLGQIGGNLLHSYKSTRVSRTVFPVWLFGCYILMTNLYQGSIFSFLTVSVPPIVPETLRALAESGYLIVTTSHYSYTLNYSTLSYHSLLKDGIIPEIMSKLGNNSNLRHVISQLDSNLVFIHPLKFGLSNWADAISSSTPISGEGKKTVRIPRKESFAILDVKTRLVIFSEYLKVTGKRYVVENREETPFHSIVFATCMKNFLYPLIHKSFNYLIDSGIQARWDDVFDMHNRLMVMRQLGNATYKKIFAKFMANKGTEMHTFPEARPVSLKVIKYVYTICGVLGISSLVAFLFEEKIWISNFFASICKVVRNLKDKIISINCTVYGGSVYRMVVFKQCVCPRIMKFN